jgi:hypothetical protein
VALEDPEVNLEADLAKGELAYSPQVLEVFMNPPLLGTFNNIFAG